MDHSVKIDPKDSSAEARELLQVRDAAAGESVHVNLDVSDCFGKDDAISSVMVVSSPNDVVGDLVISRSGFAGFNVGFDAEGGRAGVSYSIPVSVQSARNRTFSRTVEVHFSAEDDAVKPVEGTVAPADAVKVTATHTDGAAPADTKTSAEHT